MALAHFADAVVSKVRQSQNDAEFNTLSALRKIYLYLSHPRATKLPENIFRAEGPSQPHET
jgi:hypothetical protein